MPIQQGYTTRNGDKVGYYRFGDTGTMYTYEIGNERARNRARRKAEDQQAAAYASGYQG